MLAVHSLGNRKVEVVERDTPKAKDDKVLVKIKAAAICGSDLHGVYQKKEEHPRIPGHEMAGQVEKVDRTRYLKAGDRVCIPPMVGCGVCRMCLKGYTIYCETGEILGWVHDGGHAEYVLVPEHHCLKIPDDISYEAAALIPDPIGGLYHAFKNIGLNALDTIAIFGLGPMGLGGSIVAKFLGATVIGVEINEYRLNLARRLGVDHVIHGQKEDVKKKVMEITRGQGLDKAADCAGTAPTLEMALDLTRKLGKVAIIGENQKATINPSNHFNRKELSLHGSTCFNLGEMDEIISMIRKGLKPERIVTHRFPISDAAKAYRLFDEGATGKVVFEA